MNRKKNENICVICCKPYRGVGNDPAPCRDHGRCCDICKYVYVDPMRSRGEKK